MLLLTMLERSFSIRQFSFNGHPPLGVNATPRFARLQAPARTRFNGHPPLGVNATRDIWYDLTDEREPFQWAPTLGGECYAEGLSARRELAGVVSMGTHPWG